MMMMTKVNRKERGLKAMTNKEVREAMKAAGLKQWELADLVGCSENTMYRKLRTELPEDMKQHLLEVIRNHKQKGAVTE